MKVLGLDMATKTGYAVVVDGKLEQHGLIPNSNMEYPNDIANIRSLKKAMDMAAKVLAKIQEVSPDLIIIEETNQGSFRSTQKLLEFIHAFVLFNILNNGFSEKVNYVDTSKWRSVLQIRLSKDQKKHNKTVKDGKAKGKVTPKHLAVAWANATYGLELLKKDHDIADAIALATFGENNKPQSADYDLDKILLK